MKGSLCKMILHLLAITALSKCLVAAFLPGAASSMRTSTRDVSILALTPQEQAEELMERARKIRAELAALEGRTIKTAEEEMQMRKQKEKAIHERAAAERKEMRESGELRVQEKNKLHGRFLVVPESPEDQVLQAKAAVERAFQDGITRQVVRFALVPDGEMLMDNDRQWPGGAQQMYREAAGPLTVKLLRQIRARTQASASGQGEGLSYGDDNMGKQPNLKSQVIWDFDGTALVTAEASTGPKDDVQALVFANTDTKYLRDIQAIDLAMGKRLFLLVNPFWRNLDSWGFNLLAPKAKQIAQATIFERGFQETFVLLQKSVRGEDCVALKAYPYDWQLYAYAERDYWPYESYFVHLGSSVDEPSASAFAALLAQRKEFQMSKNMRQMQRMLNKDR